MAKPIQLYLRSATGYVRRIQEFRPALGTEVRIRQKWYSCSYTDEIVAFDPNTATLTCVKPANSNH